MRPLLPEKDGEARLHVGRSDSRDKEIDLGSECGLAVEKLVGVRNPAALAYLFMFFRGTIYHASRRDQK